MPKVIPLLGEMSRSDKRVQGDRFSGGGILLPPLKNEDLITEIWLLSKNKSVRAADDRPYKVAERF